MKKKCISETGYDRLALAEDDGAPLILGEEDGHEINAGYLRRLAPVPDTLLVEQKQTCRFYRATLQHEIENQLSAGLTDSCKSFWADKHALDCFLT